MGVDLTPETSRVLNKGGKVDCNWSTHFEMAFFLILQVSLNLTLIYFRVKTNRNAQSRKIFFVIFL